MLHFKLTFVLEYKFIRLSNTDEFIRLP